MRRCDEMERKLRYLEKEIKKDGLRMLDLNESPEAPQPREMIDLEVQLLFCSKAIMLCFSFIYQYFFRRHSRNWKMNYVKSIKMLKH